MKLNKKIFPAVFAVMAFAACGSGSNSNSATDSSSGMNMDDTTKNEAMQANEQKFDTATMKKDAEALVKAYTSGVMEKSMADQAIQKASNADVKAFAQQLSTDHGQLNDKLKAIAEKDNITLPSALSDSQTKDLNKLGDKSGKEYDKAFLDKMNSGHKDAIALFEKASQECTNNEIRNTFSEALPKLHEHLDMVTQLQSKIK